MVKIPPDESIKVNNRPISMNYRILLVCVIIFTLYIHNYIEHYEINLNEKDHSTCNSDLFFKLTEFLSKEVQSRPIIRKALTIVSSGLIDFSVVTFSLCWIFYSRTWRPLLPVGLFYALRGICNSIFFMKKPEDYVWGFPGFPSITVSYHDATDFFFSGHVGINLICAIELKRFKLDSLSFISYLGIFVQIAMLLFVRGHYSIDLIAGLIVAHYFNIISFKLANYVDFLINIDHKIQNVFFQNCLIKDFYNEFDEDNIKNKNN